VVEAIELAEGEARAWGREEDQKKIAEAERVRTELLKQPRR